MIRLKRFFHFMFCTYEKEWHPIKLFIGVYRLEIKWCRFCGAIKKYAILRLVYNDQSH